MAIDVILSIDVEVLLSLLLTLIHSTQFSAKVSNAEATFHRCSKNTWPVAKIFQNLFAEIFRVTSSTNAIIVKFQKISHLCFRVLIDILHFLQKGQDCYGKPLLLEVFQITSEKSFSALSYFFKWWVI